MCLLLETIKILEGVPRNISFHNERMNRSRLKLFGNIDPLKLSDYITVPENAREGIVRCRVIYGSLIKSIEYSPYIFPDIRTLGIVDAGTLIYDLKYLNRSLLTSLVNKSIADDILIVRDGCITDASFANIVFTDGKRWVTPDTCLLQGTMREMLLRKGIIKSEKITTDNLSDFTHFRLINAMLCFDAPLLPVSNIISK
jgi:4-amino-4-deoxychorismate lyase